MDVVVYRKYKLKDYTIGKLYVNGDYVCDTLEDTDRGLTQNDSLKSIASKKIYGKTAIPSGTYSVELTYSNKFNKTLPQIMDVPGFDGIRIHSGNKPEDTLGCILCGMNRGKGQVLDSRKWTSEVIRYITEAKTRNERVTITIK